MLIRAVIWYFWDWDYVDNSPTDKAIRVLNRCALLLNYLSLSWFVQGWLRIVAVVNHLSVERVFRISFLAFDLLVVVFFATVIIYQCFTQNS